MCGEQRHLRFDEFGAHRFGVPAGRPACFVLGEFEHQEVGPHALDLIRHFGANIESAHDRAQAASGSNRCQTGDAGTNHQDFRRWYLARRRDLSGKEAAEQPGGFNHGPIASDVGHRTQRIQLLSSANPRDRIDRKGGCARRRDLLQQFRILAGSQKSDQRLTLAELRNLIRQGSPHLQDDVRRVPNLLGSVGNLAAHLLVLSVMETRRFTGVRFDDHVEAEFLDQPTSRLRSGGDTTFTVDGLLRDPDLHSTCTIFR